MLKNMNLTTKLGIGFALLILSTLCVAYVGWNGLTNIESRADKAAKMADITDQTLLARLDMLYYIDQRDEKRLESLRKNLLESRATAQGLKSVFLDPKNRDNMDALVAASTAYEAGLGKFQDSEKAHADTFKTVVDAAGAVLRSTEQLGARLREAAAKSAASKDLAGVARSYELISRTDEVLQQFLLSRIEVLYYLWREDKARMEAAKGILDRLIPAAKELAGMLANPEEKALALDIAAKADVYRTRMDGFLKAAESKSAVVREMAAMAQKISSSAESSLLDQKKKMEAEAQAANLTSVAVALAALAVGALFAVYMISVLRSGINSAIAVANTVATGDVSRDVAADRGDEIGRLLGAMQHMVEAERTAAELATRLAAGDLRIEVRPRSEKDMLLVSMKEMVARLTSVVLEVQSGATNMAAGSEELSASAQSLS